jgi:hypothetical protein
VSGIEAGRCSKTWASSFALAIGLLGFASLRRSVGLGLKLKAQDPALPPPPTPSPVRRVRSRLDVTTRSEEDLDE